MEFEKSGLPDTPLMRQMFQAARGLHSLAMILPDRVIDASDHVVDNHFEKTILAPALMVGRDGVGISEEQRAAMLVWPFYYANQSLGASFPDAVREQLERMHIIAIAIKQISTKSSIDAREFLELKNRLNLTCEDLAIVKAHAYLQLRLALDCAYSPDASPDMIETLMRMTQKMIHNGSMLCVEEHDQRVSPLNGAILGTLRDIKQAFDDHHWDTPELGDGGFSFKM